MKNATVYMSESVPLEVLEIEDEPSRTVLSFSGREMPLRRFRTSDQTEGWIPEDMIIRVEKSSPYGAPRRYSST